MPGSSSASASGRPPGPGGPSGCQGIIISGSGAGAAPCANMYFSSGPHRGPGSLSMILPNRFSPRK